MGSLWIETTKDGINLKALENDEETEVCVIGAGLFGLTTAYYLTQCGKKVIVLEKGEIGEKVSGNTTGKITSQHDLFYAHLIDDYGEEYAKKYLEANEQAIKNMKQIIDKEQIECEFSTQKSYVYTDKQDEVIEIEKEVEAVKKLGKEAKFVTNIELPLKIKGAIEFDGQAQFHPRKYMIGLANAILKQNKIYNYTTVTDVEKDGDNYKIYTDKGNVKAKYVVLATHFPIINMPGFYFVKMYQSTSYLIAIETNSKLPQGMYINVKEPVYSFRTANYNGKEILLVGGVGHKTGEAIQDNSYYKELEKKAPKRKDNSLKIKSEMERLNILFQKGRISMEYYDEQYEKLESELKPTQTSNILTVDSYKPIAEKLVGNWRDVYEKLDYSHRKIFWKSIIKEIHVDPDTHKICGFQFLT